MSSEAQTPKTEPDEAPDQRPALSLVKETEEEHQDHEPDEEPGEEAGRAEGLRRLLGVILENVRAAGRSLHESVAVLGGRDGIRHLVGELTSGSVVLGTRLWAWVVVPEEEPKPKAVKKGKKDKGKQGDDGESPSGEFSSLPRPVRRGLVLVFIGLAAYRAAPEHPVLFGTGGLVVWATAALISAPRKAEGDEDGTSEEATPRNDHETGGGGTAPEEAAQLTPAQAAAALRQYVEHAVAAEHHLTQALGVHTEMLLAGLRRNNRMFILTSRHPERREEQWDVSALNAEFKDLGIPVKSINIKTATGGQNNKSGVHIKQLGDALGHAPRLPASLVRDNTPTPAADGGAPART
ncbi:hypothetical protein ACFQ7F_41835 [Streptomyces sp. NPDC056486]|uniref:hypothetical protein n=1 Tax=Streptomyces sp. NPDC056486 TaxID=3345835 RepID=UPI0036CE3401